MTFTSPWLLIAVALAMVCIACRIVLWRMDAPKTEEQKQAHRKARLASARSKTLTIIVPAHNEERGLGETLQSLLVQTVPADRIIVVADNCTDRTAEVALSYAGVEVLTPPPGVGGSKARAQNYGLGFVETDLVLPVDADTTLDQDYLEQLKPVFEDPSVAIAAGCVLTKWHDTSGLEGPMARFRREVLGGEIEPRNPGAHQRLSIMARLRLYWSKERRADRSVTQNTIWERGRLIEYLFGFTFHRAIQNMVSAPVVCSGCCSIFETKTLQRFGGFPERTIVEDMDYTWSQQIAGRRALYVPTAVARAADPKTVQYMRVQMWRWMAGFFQNVRRHFPQLLRRKQWLAFWVGMAVAEIAFAPLWYLIPLVPFLFGYGWEEALLLFFGSELLIGMPVLFFGAVRRGIPLRRIVACWPCLYANRVINLTYAWKALICELILVPLRLRRTFLTYEMGR